VGRQTPSGPISEPREVSRQTRGGGTLETVRELQTMVEVTALAIQERVARIHDALHGLRDLTLSLIANTKRSPESVAQWLDVAGFGTDEHGYFERLDVLKRARAGEVDARTQIYYAQPSIEADAEAVHRMYSLRGLADILCGLAERIPGLAWLYYQDATHFSLTYPMHDPCTVVPPDFDWHAYHTYLSVLPDVNPEREIRWTPPNIDYGGKGLMVAPSIPLYRDDTLMGVWSFDVPVVGLIEDCMKSMFIDGQDSFIVDSDGMLVAHRSLDPLQVGASGEVVRKSIAELGSAYAKVDLDHLRKTGTATVVDERGERRHVVGRRIPALNWLLIASVPEQSLLAEMTRSFTNAFDHVRQGDLAHRILPLGEELQGIVSAYNDMVGELESTLEANEQARKALDRSRRKTRAIFDGAPVGLAVLRGDRVLVDANAELARLVGAKPASLLGRSFVSLAAEQLQARFGHDLDDPERQSGRSPIETELLHGDGHLVPVRIVVRGLELDGEPHLLAGVEDLTRRRELQAQLQHTQQVEAIGKLAAGVAHDFNNLLTSVVANASFLEELVTDAEARGMADAIKVAARTGAALTSQLLAISRRDIVQPRSVSFSETLAESETLLRRLLDDDVILEFCIEEALPRVWADPGQLLQVVMNLVINARDALGDDGGRICVDLRRAPRAGGLMLSVTDDGSGIAEPLRDRVFEAFFTTKPRGTGLGLSTIRDIVREMGGEVTFQSEVGEGTVFDVFIPSLETVAARPSDASPAEAVERVVVVVDDEPVVRNIAVRILERKGLRAQACEDGEAALQFLGRLGARAGMLLTDVVMPGMSGRELADVVRTRYPELPVLFMSGYADDAIVRRGVEAADVVLLRKPFQPDELVDTVRSMMAADSVEQRG